MISPKQWIIANKYGKKGALQVNPKKTLGPQISPLKVKSGKEIKHPHPEAKTTLELLKAQYPTLFSDTTTSIEGSPKKKKYTKGRAHGGFIIGKNVDKDLL